jgi:hypothetical protein
MENCQERYYWAQAIDTIESISCSLIIEKNKEAEWLKALPLFAHMD